MRSVQIRRYSAPPRVRSSPEEKRDEGARQGRRELAAFRNARMSAAFAILILLAACSGDSRATDQSAPDPPDGANGAWFAANLPLGSYNQIVFDTHRSLENHVGDAIEECMRQLGFEYQHPRPLQASVPFRRYGILRGDDLVYVRDMDEVDADASNEEDSDAYLQALFGGTGPVNSTTPVRDEDGRQVGFTWRADGCLGQAQEVTFGSLDEYERFTSEDLLVQVTLSEATEDLWVSNDVQETIRPWVTCMVQRGFEQPDRLDYYFLVPWPENSAVDQRATAEAELACKNDEVLRALFRLDWNMQAALLNSKAALFDSYREWPDVLTPIPDG